MGQLIAAEGSIQNMIEAWSQYEGQVIEGEFRLEQYIGGTDESAVFLIEQPSEPRRAAIKLVQSDGASAEQQLERWTSAQHLSHPNLIRLLQSGRCSLDGQDLIFVVMEYAEENLGQILPERPLTAAEASEMIDPVLSALAYLHSQGWVHANLKPANIMAAKDQLKLASDNLCRIGEPFPDSGRRSVYDPPEKVAGPISPAAESWSLGMSLTEVLTQHLPALNGQDHADPELPGQLPAPLSEIVHGCLRRDPQSRLTVAEISGLLHPTPKPPAAVKVAPPATVPLAPPVKPVNQPATQSSKPIAASAAPKRHGISTGAVVVMLLVLAAIVVTIGLLRRRGDEGAAGAKPSAIGQSTDDGNRAPVSRSKPSPVANHSGTRTHATTRTPADGEVVQQLLPDVSQAARATIQGTIRVSVRAQVDRAGNVVGSSLESRGPSNYFARLSLQAAQGWKFAPISQDEQREFILRFEFRRTETTAAATSGLSQSNHY